MSIQRPLILGSCVSRDIFNFHDDEAYELVNYYARTSLISLMSPAPVASDIDVERIASPFQRRMVQYELSRNFRRHVGALNFDYMLLDFIDERHDILEIEDGVYMTLSHEFDQTGFINENPLLKDRTIQSGSTKFKILWYEALHDFLRLAEGLDFKSKILLNRVSWAKKLDSGETIPGTSEKYTDSNNALLEWMYALIEPALDSKQVLQVPQGYFVSSVSHRWGSSPFHYADQYYDYVMQLLERYRSRS